MANPVIYEVNINTAQPLDESEFMAWLSKHIEELEALPGFLPQTKVYEVDGSDFAICVQYHLESHSALQNYFDNHAEEMRSRLPQKFAGVLKFSRRILMETSINRASNI